MGRASEMGAWSEESGVVRSVSKGGLAASKPRIEIVLGDITRVRCAAIVSSICPALADGGAVDRVVRRRGGPVLRQHIGRFAWHRSFETMPVASCFATNAGDLPCLAVVHAVAPVWDRSTRGREELFAAYENALRKASDVGATTVVSMPALGVGGCGVPIEESATQAIHAARETASGVEVVRFVLSNRRVFAAFVQAFVDVDVVGKR